MENAVRHARSRVRVDAAAGPPGAVAVEDDGPGVAAEDAQRILKRGERLDRGGSAGLGLAIVQDVLDAYGWRLDLGRSGLGGLAATLAPARPAAATPAAA
jgi:signal transduction histidine kinase